MQIPDPELLLDEQLAYYRAMAPDYDEAARRDPNELERPELESALAQFGPTGDVLELAGGTGQWTASLASYTTRLTVVDASEETLAINRAKSAAAARPVDYVLADIFDWQPARRYDVVFFSFWLSHVPPGRFEAFWQLVDRALRPGGRVFFIDSALSRSHPLDHLRRDDPGPGISLRQLDDGREFNIVKVFWPPAALERRLAALGFDIAVRKTANQYCLYGQGGRRQDSSC
jgi:demethylmenaquinone methyltransferase/2-methoxy-6-polyprenyl-1,4-benzoquinol methylase